jgi:hypothetical protein
MKKVDEVQHVYDANTMTFAVLHHPENLHLHYEYTLSHGKFGRQSIESERPLATAPIE